jgi:hypothetical protein
MVGFYKGKGLVQKFENAAEAATLIGADPDTLAATLAAYTQAAAAGTDEFGKVTFPVRSTLIQISAQHIRLRRPLLLYTSS